MPVIGSGSEKTVADVVEEVRKYLMGSVPGRANILAENLNDATTDTVEFLDSVTAISEGSIIEVELEQMYVRSVDVNTKTATVIRGWGRTPATAHAAGAIAVVSPSYFAHDIYESVLDEFTALNGTGLVRFVTFEFVYNGVDQIYDSGADVNTMIPLYVQEAVFESSTTTDKWRPAKVKLVKGLDADDFPSGFGFQLLGRPSRESGSNPRTLTDRMIIVRPTVATNFTRPVSMNSEVTEDALGTGVSVTPIVAVGAAWRMLIGKEVQRVNPDRSHGSRRAEEVPAGSISFAARTLQRMKEDLLENAIEAQIQQYPPRMAM